jgi:tRNA A-37 threonylcarbamoyl transferase component Bud32
MDASPCPRAEQLEALLDERLDSADGVRLAAHVAGCSACQQVLEQLTEDTRADAPAAAVPAASRAEFFDRLKQAGPGPAGGGGDPGAYDATRRAAPSSAGAAPLDAAGEEPEPTPFVGDYEVLGMLGRGGEGVVYKARHQPLGRLVALKMLRADAQLHPEALLRFRHEAETLARLRHPNIVQVYEVGECDGRPYFALEYVEGGPLSARLAGQPLPAREAAALVETLARAVEVAHRAGVVHRDLKPSNVLLTADGTPKITDFGLAKRIQVEMSLTRTGLVLGTPGYMAPEQARAEGNWARPATWPPSRPAPRGRSWGRPATSTPWGRSSITC